MANPTTPDLLMGLYTMFYRHPSVGNYLITKNFRCTGSLKDARQMAENHCNIMGCRLNFVQPLVSNLQVEEDFKLGNKPPFLNTAAEVK